MSKKEAPKGSFKCQGGKQFTACWECKKGINGNSSCCPGMHAKSVKVGCFNGNLLDKYLLPDLKEGDKGER